MRRDLKTIAETGWDVLVIGGGISGASILRDAAMRGLKAVLVEKKDFSHATSSATSKLVHGGLRYLKNFEFGLIRESCASAASGNGSRRISSIRCRFSFPRSKATARDPSS